MESIFFFFIDLRFYIETDMSHHLHTTHGGPEMKW